MLNKVLEISKFVANNVKHIKINYDKANSLLKYL